MVRATGIFSTDANADERRMKTLDDLGRYVEHLKGIGLRVVLTSGSFDLIHLGHVKYLARAKELGDVLVVGVDSDNKIRRRKGADRPLVPEDERLEMLAYQRPVDLLYLKNDSDEKWALIKAVRPHVLVVTNEHSYDESELDQLHNFCQQVRIIERQADITTSERIRQININVGKRLYERWADIVDNSLSPRDR